MVKKFRALCQNVSLYQHVRVNTRINYILDLVFTSEENVADNLASRKELGSIDHNIVTYLCQQKLLVLIGPDNYN